MTEANGLTSSIFAIGVAEAVAIPEPSGFALAALGLLGLGIVGWRRCRRSAKPPSNPPQNPSRRVATPAA